MKVSDLLDELSGYDPNWTVEAEFNTEPLEIDMTSSDPDEGVVVIYLVNS